MAISEEDRRKNLQLADAIQAALDRRAKMTPEELAKEEERLKKIEAILWPGSRRQEKKPTDSEQKP